jgi:hypothetical protein
VYEELAGRWFVVPHRVVQCRGTTSDAHRVIWASNGHEHRLAGLELLCRQSETQRAG